MNKDPVGLLFYQKYMCARECVCVCLGAQNSCGCLFSRCLRYIDCLAFILLRYMIYFRVVVVGVGVRKELGHRFVGSNAQFRFNWASNCQPSE